MESSKHTEGMSYIKARKLSFIFFPDVAGFIKMKHYNDPFSKFALSLSTGFLN